MADLNTPNMHTIDYILLGLMLVISAGIGIYYALTGGKQRSSDEYFLANRSLPVIPVGFSLMASFMSAITTLGLTADVYFTGTMWLWFVVSFAFASWFIAYTFLPVFYNLQLTSVNEYLELRFDRSLRLCGAMCFYLQKLIYLGVVIYAPCLALATITKMDFVASVFLVGIVCTFYTTIGGMKAVVWADTFQMLIAFAGFFAIVIKGCIQLGWSNIWEINYRGGRIDLLTVDPDPRVRHSVGGIVVGGTVLWIVGYGINQWMVQRYLTCKSLGEARQSIALMTGGMALAFILSTMVGMIAYGYYHDCDPYTFGLIKKTDQLIPYLVVDIFRNEPGLTGVFMAAVFSAALSTMSSALNSLAAVTGEDIIKKKWPYLPDRIYTIINKFIALSFGVITIALAFLVSELGSLVQTALAFGGALGGPLLGLFCVGLFCPRVGTKATWVGFIVGFALALWICLGAVIYPPTYERLPLSTANYDVINGSILPDTMDGYSPVVMTTVTADMNDVDVKRPGILGLYSVSYIWYASISSLTTVIIALFCSIFGGNPPGSVDPKLLCPLSNVITPCIPKRVGEKLGFCNPCQGKRRKGEKYNSVVHETHV